MTVEHTLSERAKTSGEYSDVCRKAVDIQILMSKTRNWSRMTPDQIIAIQMIALKLARIGCGDQNHADAWHDIAGYAILAERSIKPNIEPNLDMLEAGIADLAKKFAPIAADA